MEFDVAGLAFKVEIELANGAVRKDDFVDGIAEVFEINFGLADVVFHASADFSAGNAGGGGAFVDDLDSGGIGFSGFGREERVFVVFEEEKIKDGDTDSSEDEGKGDENNAAAAFFESFFMGSLALGGGFEFFALLTDGATGFDG